MPSARDPSRDSPTRESVDLSNSEKVVEWILSKGGLKWEKALTGEFDGIGGWLRRLSVRRDGRPLDELAPNLADA